MLASAKWWAFGAVVGLMCVIVSAWPSSGPREYDECTLTDETERWMAVTVEAESGVLPEGVAVSSREYGSMSPQRVAVPAGVPRATVSLRPPAREIAVDIGRPTPWAAQSEALNKAAVSVLVPKGWRADPRMAEAGARCSSLLFRVVNEHGR